MKTDSPIGRSFTLAAAALLIGACAAPSFAQQDREGQTTAIRAGVIHIGNGERIDNGVILIRDGRIISVGADVAVPADAEVIEVASGAVTPGLIDANAQLEPTDLVSQPENRRRGVLGYMLDPSVHGHAAGQTECLMCDGTPFLACALADLHGDLEEGEVCPVCGGMSPEDEWNAYVSGVAAFRSPVEASSEVVPHTRMIDSINFNSPDFQRLVRGGVTTVYASPDASAVIGPRGTIVHTAGPLRDRVAREIDAVVAAISDSPTSQGGRNRTPGRFGVDQMTRRPQSRMGVAWVFRKAFHDAAKQADDIEVFGADQAPPQALEVLSQVRSGEVPLRVRAATQRDMLTAFRLADEFDLTFTLLEAREAHRCLEEIAGRDISVVFGPIDTDAPGRGSDEHVRLGTLRELIDAGVPTALSAQDLREEDGLARQAMYAMRAGLSFEEALRSVTETPAKMLGLIDEIGTIATGKRADLVVWNGEPFAATSKPVAVLVNGRIEFSDLDRESSAQETAKR